MNFALVPTSSIIINRAERQRRELTNIEELAESIRLVGLLQPIIITHENVLVAGERRLTACISIGYDPIPALFFEDLDEPTRQLIELEENVKREELPWKDHVLAVQRYHEIRLSTNPDWTLEDTGNAIGVSRTFVGRHLLVASHLDKPLVADAPAFSTALNAATRIEERQSANTKSEVKADVLSFLNSEPGAQPDPQPELPLHPPVSRRFPGTILNANFTEWVKTYTGPRFNFIHCDFPYGVGVGDNSGQSARGSTGSYADSPDIYRHLLSTLCTHTETLASDSAHLMFWFSMDFYQETVDALTAAGWRVNPFPLIWHKSDNTGILPDPNRGPRRTYETALLASRGDRKVVKAVANSVGSPVTRQFHTSEKPRPVLEHFFRMLVDENSSVLDPTCGSANALRVAAALGASPLLGLELDPDFAEMAMKNVSNM